MFTNSTKRNKTQRKQRKHLVSFVFCFVLFVFYPKLIDLYFVLCYYSLMEWLPHFFSYIFFVLIEVQSRKFTLINSKFKTIVLKFFLMAFSVNTFFNGKFQNKIRSRMILHSITVYILVFLPIWSADSLLTYFPHFIQESFTQMNR